MSNFYMQVDYTVSQLRHLHRVRVGVDTASPPAIGDDPNSVTLVSPGGSSSTLQEVAAAYSAVFCGLFGEEMTLGSVELWKYPFGTGANGSWFAAAAVNDATLPLTTAGTNALSCDLASGHIVTFRDSIGGIMRLVFAEASNAHDDLRTTNTLGPEKSAWFDEIMDATKPYVDKHGGKPAAGKSYGASQNEKLFRARNR
jgi:hypothetical protein